MSYNTRSKILTTIIITITAIFSYFFWTSSYNITNIPSENEFQSGYKRLEEETRDIKFKDVSKDIPREQKLKNNFYVQDEHNYLSEEQKIIIYNMNKDVIEQLDNVPQLVFYLTDTLNGQNIDQFKVEKGRELGIGSKEHNSGILFVFAFEDRKFALATGYGMEEYITDSMKDTIVTPYAKNKLVEKNYDEAVQEVAINISNTLLASPLGYNIKILNDYTDNYMLMKRKENFLKIILIFVFTFACSFLIFMKNYYYKTKIIQQENRKFLQDYTKVLYRYDKKILNDTLEDLVLSDTESNTDRLQYLLNKNYKENFKRLFIKEHKNYLVPFSDSLVEPFLILEDYSKDFESMSYSFKDKINRLNDNVNNIHNTVYSRLKNNLNVESVDFKISQLNMDYEEMMKETIIVYIFHSLSAKDILDNQLQKIVFKNDNKIIKLFYNRVLTHYEQEIIKILEKAKYPYIAEIITKELGDTVFETTLKDIEYLLEKNNNFYLDESSKNKNYFRGKLYNAIKPIPLFESVEFTKHINNYDFYYNYGIYIKNKDDLFVKEINNILKDFYKQTIHKFTRNKYPNNQHIEDFDAFVKKELKFSEFKIHSYEEINTILKELESNYKERYRKEQNTGKSYNSEGVLIYNDTSHYSQSSSSDYSGGGGGDFGGGGFSGGW